MGCYATQKCLYVYLDYHHVLDSGQPKLLEMARFLNRLDEIQVNRYGRKLYRTLISYGGQSRNEETLKELCQAGVVNLLDQIVFTRQRTSEPPRGSARYRQHYTYFQTFTWRKDFSPRPITHEVINYTVFEGGKDEFIHRGHAKRSQDVILFVDDKAATLRAVCEPVPWTMPPQLCGIEMHPWGRGFQTTRGPRYDHCAKLDELLDLIKAWCSSEGKLVGGMRPEKRRRDSETEDAQARKKAYTSGPSRTSEIRNVVSRDVEATIQSHMTTLGLRDPNSNRMEVSRAFMKTMKEQTNAEGMLRVRNAFQAVWNKVPW